MGWQAEVMGSRTAVDHAADVVLAALTAPLLTFVHIRAPSGWLVVAANSLCWGLALWLVLCMFGRFRRAE
jgi:hypothetical protein